MFVTVAVCTWNRSNLLDQTLTQMKKLQVPAGVQWELLVVNNNSPDGTDAVIAKHVAEGVLPIRRLFEPTQGHVHARNCAVAASRGDLIIWTDDDVLVESNWVAEYVAAAERFPAASYFGGPVRPWFPSDPPAWMAKNLDTIGWFWALKDKNSGTRELGDDEQVFGANMAFRTEVLRRYPFDPNTGHVGANPRGGDETMLQRRLRPDGHRGVWVHSAPVLHYIPAERMTLTYLWDLQRKIARIQYSPRDNADLPKVLSVPWWILRAYVAGTAKLAVLNLVRNSSEQWAPNFLWVASLRGMIDAARQHATTRRPGRQGDRTL